jgi:hypothetical protein
VCSAVCTGCFYNDRAQHTQRSGGGGPRGGRRCALAQVDTVSLTANDSNKQQFYHVNPCGVTVNDSQRQCRMAVSPRASARGRPGRQCHYAPPWADLAAALADAGGVGRPTASKAGAFARADAAVSAPLIAAGTARLYSYPARHGNRRGCRTPAAPPRPSRAWRQGPSCLRPGPEGKTHRVGPEFASWPSGLTGNPY